MNIQNRVEKLERDVKPAKITWREFVEIDQEGDYPPGWDEFIENGNETGNSEG